MPGEATSPAGRKTRILLSNQGRKSCGEVGEEPDKAEGTTGRGRENQERLPFL